MDDIERRIAEILEEPDPATFDAKVDDLVKEIVDENPEGPDFYTVKTHIMDSIARMFEILNEQGES